MFVITVEGADGQVLDVSNVELNPKQLTSTLNQLLARPILIARGQAQI